MATLPSLFAPNAPNEGETAERENPEEQNPQLPDYGPENQDLPEELQNALLCLVQEAQRQELYQRRIEVMRDRRNRFYERGLQHIYEDMQTGVFVQGAPGAWVPDQNGGQIQCSSYVADYNIFGRALQIIIAKLSETSPGIDFQPDSGDSAIDEQASQAAEGYRLLYDRRNDLKDLITAIGRMMGLSGRVVTWTRTVADKQRWGTDEQGTPRHVQTTSVFGTLEAKVPILAKSFTECPYLLITEDPHIAIAKHEHPYFADKISDQGDEGVSDTQFERLARLGALQGSAAAFQLTDVYSSFVERKHGFFRPAFFTDKTLDSCFYDPAHADDVDEEGNPKEWTLRDACTELFPDGCHLRFVGQQYVGSRNVCLDDELGIDFPYAGDGMSRMAVMDPAIVIQDRFNDDMNLYAEWKDFGAPSTWVNGEKTEIQAINSQTASPFAYRPMKLHGGALKLQDCFWREPDPNLPASFMQHTEYMATQLLQFILAIPSAVQGAGMPDQKTASGYGQAIQQAMGQLGVIYGAVTRLLATIYRQAALLAAKDDDGKKSFVVPGPKGTVTIDIEALGKGHFLAHPDSDSGYPESTVQKRATLASIMDMASKNPILAQALFQSPDNWDFFARVFGVPEIVIPEARVRRKQMAEIELLIQQGPVGPSPEEIEQAQVQHAAATMTAHTASAEPPQPFDPAAMQHSSVPVDPLDYHEWEFEECREKLSDWPWVQQQIAAGNQAGIDNLRLHAMEHQKFVAQAAMAAQAQAQAQAAAQPQQQQLTAHKPAAKPEPKPQQPPTMPQ